MENIKVQQIIVANIKYYAVLEFVKDGGKTPKYQITMSAGNYEPMEQLKGKDGQISMYLMGKQNKKENAPEYYLQAKNSLNFTGLKDYFINRQPSVFCYGYPSNKKRYANGKKTNPFFDNSDDGYLFIMHFENSTSKPQSIELVVLDKARTLIELHNKALMQGGYNDILNVWRKQAENNKVLL